MGAAVAQLLFSGFHVSGNTFLAMISGTGTSAFIGGRVLLLAQSFSSQIQGMMMMMMMRMAPTVRPVGWLQGTGLPQ
jgi:hypothetical protein